MVRTGTTGVQFFERVHRRAFMCGAAASIGLLWSRPSVGRAAAAQARVGLNVRQFGVSGNGIDDDTLAFERALRASPVLFVPAGVYLIERLFLPAGTALLTEGFATVFQQRGGLPDGVRILNVIGSGVHIGDCVLKGNIETDPGEQRHGVFVAATRKTGNLSDITIGNLRGVNIRGDLLYLGAAKDQLLSNVTVGDVDGSNILRNVVSVTGGSQISIGRISGTRVGYMHLDIEPDIANAPVVACKITSVTGGFVQVAGQSAESYVDEILIELLDLTPPAEKSDPAYHPGSMSMDALEIRNVRSLDVQHLLVSGFAGAVIRQIWNPGALSDQYVHIHEARLSNCARLRGRAYVLGDRHVTHLTIDDLTIDIARAGVDAVFDCKSARIGRASGRIRRGNRLIAERSEPLQPFAFLAAGVTATAVLFRAGGRLCR